MPRFPNIHDMDRVREIWKPKFTFLMHFAALRFDQAPSATPLQIARTGNFCIDIRFARAAADEYDSVNVSAHASQNMDAILSRMRI
jgi:hypothetical protein